MSRRAPPVRIVPFSYTATIDPIPGMRPPHVICPSCGDAIPLSGWWNHDCPEAIVARANDAALAA